MCAESGPVRAARKDDHVRLALQQRAEAPARNEFDDVEFVHHALDAIDASAVDLTVDVDLGPGSAPGSGAGAGIGSGSVRWPVPFYVNGMTGGTPRTERINRAIASAARETGLPMACGSVSVALDHPETARSFTVIREENPDGFVLANLGVERDPDDARRAVELLRADALQVHLNAVQETAMPEGSRDFSAWARRLERLVAAAPVPVVVKEVGFGLSRRTLERLRGIGVRVADVSGRGGTDFLAIENARRDRADFSMLTGFGQSAPACLLDAVRVAPGSGGAVPQLLASGGVRHPLDVVRALALGARAVGVAGAFLATVVAAGAEQDRGVEAAAAALTEQVRDWQEQTAAILALLGAADPAALVRRDVLIRGRLREFCELRGIDAAALARRSDRPAPPTAEAPLAAEAPPTADAPPTDPSPDRGAPRD